MNKQIKILRLHKNKQQKMCPSNYQYIYDKSVEPIKPKRVRNDVKIQYIRQDLDDAIKQVKLHFKRKKEKKSNNPQVIVNTDKTQNSDRMFFTNNYARKYQQRLSQIQEKKKELVARSLDKQMKARLQRKIKQNIELKEKMNLLKDLKERKEQVIMYQTQMMIEKQWKQKKKEEQKKLLHQSSVDKVKMMRRSRVVETKKQIINNRAGEQESFKDMQFKKYLDRKEEQEHHMLLKSKNQLMKSRSTHRMRKMSIPSRQSRLTESYKDIPRFIRTSQGGRAPRGISYQNTQRKQEQQEFENEEMIIKQYSAQQEENKTLRTQSGKSQRKLNQGVRIFKENEQEIQLEEIDKNNGEQHFYGKFQSEKNNEKQASAQKQDQKQPKMFINSKLDNRQAMIKQEQTFKQTQNDHQHVNQTTESMHASRLFTNQGILQQNHRSKLMGNSPEIKRKGPNGEQLQ